MRVRIAIAGVAGGLTLFLWGGLSHAVLHFGDVGVQSVPEGPADQALLDSIHGTLPASGLYFYPGMNMKKSGDKAAMDAWTERTKTNPHGIIVNTTTPYAGMGPQLGREVLIDIGVALVAAMLLSCALHCCTGVPSRILFVTMLGLVTALRPIQQWNWYEFPCNFTLAQVGDGLLGFLVMGIPLALILKPKADS